MADLANRRSAYQFRQLVAQRFEAVGLPARATPPDTLKSLLEAFERDDNEPFRVLPDVDGLGPDWHLSTLATIRQEGFSAALDAAERDARFRGARYAALAAYRRGRDSGEAYAIVTVDTLAAIVAEVERRAVA